MMKYNKNKPFGYWLSAACLSLLLAAGGCSNDETVPASPGVGEVALFTKASTAGNTATGSHRLLVFKDGEEGACVQNHSFIPGSGSVKLEAGTYQFATLTVPEGLELPEADKKGELVLTQLLSFGDNPVREFYLSKLQPVTVGGEGVIYTADLQPVTAIVSLRLSNVPDGTDVTFELSNMYTSVDLNGNYSGKASYPLALDGETVCFPCNGPVFLTYRVGDGVSQTLYVGGNLEAGNRLSLELAWSDDARTFIFVSASLDDWESGNGEGENGTAT